MCREIPCGHHPLSKMEDDDETVALYELNSLNHAAKFLGVPPRTLASMAADGTIESLLVGRTRAFPRPAIENFIAENTRGRVIGDTSGAAPIKRRAPRV
jgi:excisionase family DNA binding protein